MFNYFNDTEIFLTYITMTDFFKVIRAMGLMQESAAEVKDQPWSY